MHRGYVRLWRKIDESAIWHMPALHLKVFIYLIHKANWTDKLMPTNSDIGIWVSRGTLITSIDRIAEGVSFYERNVERKPNKRTIYSILEWLKVNSYIVCESNAHGTGIFVINYNTYNDSQGAEVTQTAPHDAPQSKQQMHTTKEVTKKVKKAKKTNLPGTSPGDDGKQEVVDYFHKVHLEQTNTKPDLTIGNIRLLHKIVTLHGKNLAMDCIDDFFKLDDDNFWIKNHGHGVYSFSKCCPKIAEQIASEVR